MKAAVLSAPNALSLESTSDPVLNNGDMLIRVRAATVCGTDIRIYRGRKTAGVRYPSIIGHEFSGEILDTGGHEGFTKGDRVALCPALACGYCERCKRGQENLCTAGANVGYEIDGAFAELFRMPSTAVLSGNVKQLPDHISFEEAALTEPLACVINGQNLVNVSSVDTVVVLGGGPIGQLHVRLAKLCGAARIILADPNLPRRQAASAGGAHITLNSNTDDVVQRVRDETHGRGADVVICAIGNSRILTQATDMAAFGGRISLFAGFSTGESAVMDVNAIHYRELVVTGAFGLSRHDYDTAFDLITSGRFDVKSLITHRYPFNAIIDALNTAETNREAIKVAVLNGTMNDDKNIDI